MPPSRQRPRARWKASYFAERIAERVIVGDLHASILAVARETFGNEFLGVPAIVVVEGCHPGIGPVFEREVNKSAAEGVMVLFVLPWGL
jgi:hypothetical protein